MRTPETRLVSTSRGSRGPCAALAAVVALAFTGAAACSQPGSTPAPGASTTNAASPTFAAAPAASAAPASSSSIGTNEEPFVVQTEKFGDGQKAFAAAKDALLTKYYAAGLTEEDVYRAAVRGMVEDIDARMHRWNKLLSPSELAEIETELKGEIVGIGVSIRFDDASGHIEILGTSEGSPAAKAGLQAHDTIVSVNGKLFRGKRMMEAVHELRGKAGDPVTLSVLREDKLLSVTVSRAPVQLQEVHHIVVDGVGVLSVAMFTAKTVAAMRSALDDFGHNHVRAIALDLRGNHGGSFDDAVHAAELFLPSGAPIVKLERREGKEETVNSKGAPPLATLPVTILVNQDTSSSAELLAGALSENLHARVVGMRTYGKWTVQSIDELGNGYAIKYTTALFHTPSGKSYEGTGMSPDVEVDADRAQVERACFLTDPAARLAADVQLRTAITLLKP
jgi:carboxyl-terminal processing protease